MKSYLYGASALAAAANSGSHLSPLASNFSVKVIRVHTSHWSRIQPTFIVKQLFSRLGGVLSIWWLDNSINRTTLLAEPAVNTLRHVDIISGCSSASIFTLLRFNGDRLSRANLRTHLAMGLRNMVDVTYSFTKLACDAALFTGGVSSQSMFASETWRNRSLSHISFCTITQAIAFILTFSNG